MRVGGGGFVGGNVPNKVFRAFVKERGGPLGVGGEEMCRWTSEAGGRGSSGAGHASKGPSGSCRQVTQW